MASTMSLLLALAQLSSVVCLPTGDAKQEPHHLDERAVQLASDIQPTISYSTAIESLQSATITALPSITGVCGTSSATTANSYDKTTADCSTEYSNNPSFWWWLHQGSCSGPWCDTIRTAIVPLGDAPGTWRYCPDKANLREHIPTDRDRPAGAFSSMERWSLGRKRSRHRWRRSNSDEQVLRQLPSWIAKQPHMDASLSFGVG